MINPGFIIDNSSINAVKAKVELYDGSTLVKTCTCGDVLQDFTVDRIGESSKFFGFGVCQALNMTLIDMDRELLLTRGNTVKVAYGDGTNFVYPHPTFYIEEITRDETTNSLSIVAYDALYKASAIKISEIDFSFAGVPNYSIINVFSKCAAAMGLKGVSMLNSGVDESYIYTQINANGEEKIRSLLDDAAEVFASIYYVNNEEYLTLRRLDAFSPAVETITKDKYFSLKTGDSVAIEAICHATELGDNVSTDIAGTEGGITQYMRDNMFWSIGEHDIGTLLEEVMAAVSGLSINQFVCEDWMGNYLLEIGDKLAFATEDSNIIYTYLLNDTITFDGTLSEATQWIYEPNDGETPANSTNLGERLNQTFAKVDKVAKEITLLVGEVEETSKKVAELTLDTDGIYSSVENVQTNLNSALDGVSSEIETLTSRIDATMTSSEVELQISSALEQGAAKVETTTGYTFNEQGLRISKSGSGVENVIDNTGMYVKRDGENILIANTIGVEATNLHAKTYLIIGENSRFEDYENGSRTGCFFIGG